MTVTQPRPPDPAASPPFAFISATAGICGALVMVLELLGSRVVGPFFGVSLFVWTSMITVALIALAAGYAAGGYLADRRRDPGLLYALILATGLLVLLVPYAQGPVLTVGLSFGLRRGALFSSLVLFGPPLFLLGCVSPYLIRLAAVELNRIGRTVGVLSAVSTFGSFVGTILTGFVLIPRLGVSRIFGFAGLLLLLLGAAYFLFFRRRWQALPLLVLPLALFVPRASGPWILPGGTTVTEVESRGSYYGTVKVLDYARGPLVVRDLLIDGLVQGGIDLANGYSVYGYHYFLQFIPYLTNPGGRDCLVVGLGVGSIPRWYEQQGIKVDVVDIDPTVVSMARRHFGFRTSGDVFVADARAYLTTTARLYDYIILDVFTGDTTPTHLLSLESLRLARARLREGGVLGVNVIGAIAGDTFITASIVKTLREVFPTVGIYPLFDPAASDGMGNLAIVATARAAVNADPRAASQFVVHPSAGAVVGRFFGKEFVFPAGTRAIVLTDEYNPADFYDLEVKEWLRRTVLAGMSPDMIL